MTSLVLPRRLAGAARSRGHRVRDLPGRGRAVPRPVEHPGRPARQSAGSWLDDLTALHKTVTLCWHCAPKFQHKRAGYYKDGRFPFVWARCDDCRRHNSQTHIYIHESLLASPSGLVTSGVVWTPV